MASCCSTSMPAELSGVTFHSLVLFLGEPSSPYRSANRILGGFSRVETVEISLNPPIALGRSGSRFKSGTRGLGWGGTLMKATTCVSRSRISIRMQWNTGLTMSRRNPRLSVRGNSNWRGPIAAVDTVVIGAPMDNFSISSSLKGWIDQIVRIGKRVGYRPISWPRTDFRFGIECEQTGLSWKRGRRERRSHVKY